jgi:anti-sigma regulatory factor (Ser/Thr protein kinase)
MKEFASITIPSSPKFLSLIRTVTSAMAEVYGMTDRTREHVKLAVDEACSNVIKHAYGGDTGQKIIVKYFLERSFEVVIEDSGAKARPGSIAGRSLDDLRPGGLGVHFIKRTFDVFVFDQRKKKGNRLRLIRHRRKEDEDRDIRA